MEAIELVKLQEILDKGILRIEALLAQNNKPAQIRYRSQDIKELVTALAKAQSEFTSADQNKVNTYFKDPYADFKSVVASSRPALSKYGLSVVQSIINEDDGSTHLITTLFHASGEFIESRLRIVATKNDIQTISSHTEKLKRLAYASLVGVVIENLDDDGEIAVSDFRIEASKGTALNTNYNAREQAPQVITREQLEELEYELAEYSDIAENILNGLNLQSLADMPKSKYMSSIERIREIKYLRKGKK